MAILEPACKHRPLTTKHLSVAWCSACQDWLLHCSQSGRRDESGMIVLIEVLQVGRLGKVGEDPNDLMWAVRQFMSSAIELEHDRLDFDQLR